MRSLRKTGHGEKQRTGTWSPAATMFIVGATLMAWTGPAEADLRLHFEAGGVAPINSVLSDAGAGATGGAALDFEIVELLALGAFYSFHTFLGDHSPEREDVLDHAAGLRLNLRYVKHRGVSWFGTGERSGRGEAFMEIELAYHRLDGDDRLGWAFAMGYRVLVAGPFGLGPFFRLRHVVPFKDESHQLFALFGLNFFFSFNVGRDRVETEEPPESGAFDDSSN